MRNSILNVIEMIIGVILFGLGLIFLISNQKALSKVTKKINIEIIEKENLIMQSNVVDTEIALHTEIIAAIMGYKDYPIMVDNNVIPSNGQDYEKYFSYVKNGYYEKTYKLDEERNIEMIIYTFIGR